MPIRQPTSVSVAASTRNWNMISRRVAPRALRTPISRVRSVTEIIMMATTPTPPTMSPTLDSAIMTMKNAPVTLLKVSSSLSCVTIAKLFSWLGLRPRLIRSAAVTSSIACGTLAVSVGRTANISQPF